MNFQTGEGRSLWLFAALAWLLGGCASVPAPLGVSEETQLWQQRQADLARLDHWLITGRIGIQSAETGWHATLHWRQAGRDFNIVLNAPLGQGSAQLQGNSAGVELSLSDGQRLHAADPDSLLDRALGTPVPVSALYYWVRGLPLPARPAGFELDGQGRLLWLEQAGWRVDFRRYESVQGRDLPTKIFLDNEEYKVRLVLDSWTPS